MPIPPQSVRSNARRGLSLRKEHGRGGTQIGVARARDLANGKDIPLATLKRMNSFFSRHEGNKKGKDWDKPSNGKIAWLLWGGDSGWSWAKSQIRKSEKSESENGVLYDALVAMDKEEELTTNTSNDISKGLGRGGPKKIKSKMKSKRDRFYHRYNKSIKLQFKVDTGQIGKVSGTSTGQILTGFLKRGLKKGFKK